MGHKGLGVEFLPGTPASGHCELKWREPHESPKFVDFAIPAPLPKAISKASGFAGFTGAGDRLPFRILDLGFWVQDLGSRILGLGFTIWV